MSSPNRRDFDGRGSRGGRAGLKSINPSPLDGLSELMAGEETYTRRKRPEHSRTGKSAPTRTLRREQDPALRASREALDVARYVSDMTAQLEAMANAARLELLAYFLGMAKAESEMFVRTSTISTDETEDDDSPAATTDAR